MGKWGTHAIAESIRKLVHDIQFECGFTCMVVKCTIIGSLRHPFLSYLWSQNGPFSRLFRTLRGAKIAHNGLKMGTLVVINEDEWDHLKHNFML